MNPQNQQHLLNPNGDIAGAHRNSILDNAFRRNHDIVAGKPDLCGTSPSKVVHIECARLDVELVSQDGGKQLGRPFLAIALGSDRTTPLGWTLCTHEPDASVILELTKQVIRRQGHVPAALITDSSASVRSYLLDQFCAVRGIDRRLRPPGKPTDGVVERKVRDIQRQLRAELQGHSGAIAGVSSAGAGRWPIQRLKSALAVFVKRAFRQAPHP